MPEGPSILLVREAINQFEGKQVIAVEAIAKSTKAEYSIKTWWTLKVGGNTFWCASMALPYASIS